MQYTQTKSLKIPLRLSIVALLIGAGFKIMHWPYASAIMVSSFVSIAVLYFFRFVRKKEKKYIDYVKLVLVTAWSVNGSLTILHWPLKLVFQILTISSFVVWVFLEGQNYFQTKENKVRDIKKKTLNLILMGAAIISATGIFLKIMHWPFGIHFIITGFGIGIIWFVMDSFLDKN